MLRHTKTKEPPKKEQIQKQKFPAGTDRIQRCLDSLGVRVSLAEAEELWRKYSTTQGQMWLELPATDNELTVDLKNKVAKGK